MKIFQSIQQNFVILGITVGQARQQSTFKFRHLMIFFILSVCATSEMLCLITLAESFEEYTETIYGLFSIIMFAVEYGIHIWGMKRIFKFIENFGLLIESSELN